MAEVYTRINTGTIPVTEELFKDFVHLPQSAGSQDGVIVTLLTAATEYAERYTRRDFRINTYELQLDTFPSGAIELRRDPITSITDIIYKIDEVDTEVDSDTYYLLKDRQTSWVVLAEDQEWPSDGDDTTAGLLGSIIVTFDTEPFSCEGEIGLAIMQHASRMWSERGDCSVDQAARDSGATEFYDQIRVVRVGRSI